MTPEIQIASLTAERDQLKAEVESLQGLLQEGVHIVEAAHRVISLLVDRCQRHDPNWRTIADNLNDNTKQVFGIEP